MKLQYTQSANVKIVMRDHIEQTTFLALMSKANEMQNLNGDEKLIVTKILAFYRDDVLTMTNMVKAPT